MFRWLKNIKNKSESEKNAFAFGVAGIITVVIFVVWISNFFISISGGWNTDLSTDIATPVSAIKESFGRMINNNSEDFERLKQRVETAIESIATSTQSTSTEESF